MSDQSNSGSNDPSPTRIKLEPYHLGYPMIEEEIQNLSILGLNPADYTVVLARCAGVGFGGIAQTESEGKPVEVAVCPLITLVPVGVSRIKLAMLQSGQSPFEQATFPLPAMSRLIVRKSDLTLEAREELNSRDAITQMLAGLVQQTIPSGESEC